MVLSNVLTIGEIERCWSKLLEDRYRSTAEARDELIFGFALDTGARPREIAAVRWSAWQLAGADGGFLTIDPESAKRGRTRQVAATRRLCTLLENWLSVCPPETDPKCVGFIFGGRSGRERITTRTVQRAINRVSHATLGRKLTPYELRHTFATQLLRVSNLRVVQDALGHRSPTTTQIYTHVQTPDLANAVTEYESLTSLQEA
jgi:integrase